MRDQYSSIKVKGALLYHKTTRNSWIVNKDLFKYCKPTHLTDICVRARVVIHGIKYLPEIGLYNGAYITIMS